MLELYLVVQQIRNKSNQWNLSIKGESAFGDEFNSVEFDTLLNTRFSEVVGLQEEMGSEFLMVQLKFHMFGPMESAERERIRRSRG